MNKTWESAYRLDLRDDRCNDQHGCEGDHDSVRDVVYGKEHGHEGDHGQDEGLETRVGHVVEHAPPEHDLDDRLAHPLLVRADLYVLFLELVFHQGSTSWKQNKAYKCAILLLEWLSCIILVTDEV